MTRVDNKCAKGVSLFTGLLITDWTGILKYVFMLRGMQLKVITFGYD